MRKEAENRAEESYQARISALEIQYQERRNELEKQLKTVFNKNAQEVSREEKKL